MENTGGRQVSRPSGQGRQPSQGTNQRRRGGCTESPGRETREDQTTPEEEEERKGGEKHKKHNAHYLIAAIRVARNLFLSINYSYFISVIQYSGESGCS